MWRNKILAILLALPSIAFSFNEEAPDSLSEVSRPVTQIYNLEAGGVRILDTYLSPLYYSGYSLALSGVWTKALPAHNPRRLTMRFDASLRADFTDNPGRTASMYALEADFSWGLARRWKLPYGLQLTAGGSAGVEAGVIYLPRNGNNPASALASFDIAAKASLSRVISLGKVPVLLSENISIPSFSLFFSPQYGEPYYEIYLGNHSGLIHAGWWGNHFGIDNLIAADMDFGSTALRIGYHFRVRSSFVCQTNISRTSHAFVIGVIPHGLGLKPKPSPKTININALY